MKVKTSFSLVLLIIVVIPSFSQEDIYQRAFRWFPDAAYYTFGYVNVEEIKKLDIYQGYLSFKKMQQQNVMGLGPDLPEKLYNEASLISYCRPYNEDFKVAEDYASKAEKVFTGKMSNEEIKAFTQKSMALLERMKAATLVAFQLSMSGEIIKELVEKGDLTETGEKISQFPVFLYKGAISSPDSNYYLCLTATGEVLAAPEVKLLKGMVAAGNGAVAGLLDNQEYLNVVAATEDRFLVWSGSSSKPILNIQLQELEKKQASAEEVEKVKTKYEKGYSYQIKSDTFDKNIATTTITQYKNETNAKAAFEKMTAFINRIEGNIKGALSKAAGELKETEATDKQQKLLNRARNTVKRSFANNTYELKGSRVITTVVTDKGQIKMMELGVKMRERAEEKARKTKSDESKSRK